MINYKNESGEGSFEVLSFIKETETKKRGKIIKKDFKINVPLRLIKSISFALNEILESKSGLQKPFINDYGEVDFSQNAKLYNKMKFKLEANYYISTEEAQFGSSRGPVTYDSLALTRVLNNKDKQNTNKNFTLNIPARLIPVIKQAVDYLISKM